MTHFVVLESGLRGVMIDDYMKRVTIAAFFNNALTLGTISYIFVNNTVALDKCTLFFAKQLPFNEVDVSVSFLLFKLVVSLSLFELVMIIATPVAGLITKNLFMIGSILLTVHFVFVATFLLDILYQALVKVLPKVKLWLSFILDIISIVISVVYFVKLRFPLEVKRNAYMKYTKAIVSGTIIWLILFVSDWLIELFQMTETGEKLLYLV